MPAEEKDNQNNEDVVENNDTTNNDTDVDKDKGGQEQYSEEDIRKETAGMDAEEAAKVRKALKEKNEEAKKHRLRAKEYEEKVRQFEELDVDADTVRQWKEEREQAEMDRLEAEKNWEEIKERLKKDKEESVSKERERAQQLEEQLNELRQARERDVVEKEAITALNKLEGEPAFIMPYLEKEVSVIDDNGKPRAVIKDDITGDPRTKDDGSYFTIEDRLMEMREDSVFGKAFKAPDVSGSGSNPSSKKTDGRSNNGKPPKINRSQATERERISYVRKYGVEAWRNNPR